MIWAFTTMLAVHPAWSSTSRRATRRRPSGMPVPGRWLVLQHRLPSTTTANCTLSHAHAGQASCAGRGPDGRRSVFVTRWCKRGHICTDDRGRAAAEHPMRRYGSRPIRTFSPAGGAGITSDASWIAASACWRRSAASLLLAQMDHVYVATSQMGFEALMLGNGDLLWSALVCGLGPHHDVHPEGPALHCGAGANET
jgi:hypothetical protein